MSALATVDDYEAVAGPAADPARTERLIEMSSAVVERWCRRSFSYVEDDVVTITVTDGDLILPNGPVIDVTAITGPDGLVYADTSYTWVSSGRVSHALATCRTDWACGDYAVTYSHGYDPIPDDIIVAVCQIVDRMLSGPGGGITSESIGEASFSYAAGGARVSDGERELLKPYRRTVTSVVMSR